MQGVAAAAAIADAPVIRHVQFAITGDPETDLIAGIMAVFAQSDANDPAIPYAHNLTQPQTVTRWRTAQRVCHYLAERFAAHADANDRSQQKLDQDHQLRLEALKAQGQSLGRDWRTIPGTPAPPTEIPEIPLRYTTSFGNSDPYNGLHDDTAKQPPVSLAELMRSANALQELQNTLQGEPQSGTHSPST